MMFDIFFALFESMFCVLVLIFTLFLGFVILLLIDGINWIVKRSIRRLSK